MNLIRLLQGDRQPEVDLKRTYDAVVIGSGAAGGMAAHVLTSRGMKVLMLEAGKKLDIDKELKSMEWPYDHPRRGDMPPGHHALRSTNTPSASRPTPPDSKFTKVYSYVQGWGGTDYCKNIVVDEKDHPYTGTNYAWVRARCLGGKTNIWGRLALRLSDYDFKAKSHDGYGEDWPIAYKDIEPYYDRVDRYLGISGVKENLPYLPDSLFQRPTRLTAAEVTLRNSLKKMDRVLTPYRAGVTTDGLKHNKYRSRCFGRGACSRRAGGCDIHAAFDSPTGLIYPGDGHRQPDAADQRDRARDPGRHARPARRAASRSSTRRPDEPTRRAAKVVVRRGVDARVGAAAAALEVRRAPERHRQLERSRRPQLLRARHGAERDRPGQGPRRQAADASTTGGRAGSTSRASGTSPTSIRTSSARYGFEGSGGTRMFPGQRARDARLRRGVQEDRARLRRRVHQHGRLRRSAGALREPGRARPRA